MLYSLSKVYTTPLIPLEIKAVDDQIFVLNYFSFCVKCSFCNDQCCQFGADIDIENVRRILDEKPLEEFVQTDPSKWFQHQWRGDAEFPGGRYTRSQVLNGKCVFLSRTGRGCSLHLYSLQNSKDYHALKPLVCMLFPITFDDSVLFPSHELQDGSLICANQGESAYRGVREELLYYFGDGIVDELDRLEHIVLKKA